MCGITDKDALQVRFKVAEKFVSINGEGMRAGELAVFVRFCGCNLRCSYCDTAWAWEDEAPGEWLLAEEIYEYIKACGVRNVTLTGGEPLRQTKIVDLLRVLCGDEELSVEIETNGSQSLAEVCALPNRPHLTVDYKLPLSGMEAAMRPEEFWRLDERDTVKFVCGGRADLERAAEIMAEYKLISRVGVYLSPVFGVIEPAEMVGFMRERGLNGVKLQLQLHKFIWPPDARGV